MLAVVLVSFVLSAQSDQKSSDTLRTFTSDAFGFSFTYPLQLIRNTGDFRSKLNAPKNPERGIVLFSAFETPSPGKSRESVVIMSEDATLYRAKWGAKSCLREATTIQSRQGWVVLRQDTPATFDSQKFFRADYEHTNPLLFESAVCTIWKGSVLEFILSAGSEEEVNQLFQSLDTIRFKRPKSKGDSPLRP